MEVGSSLVVPWSVFGSSLVFDPRKIWIVLGAGFLTKSTFANTHKFGGRAYPVRHYPIAIRLRDREGRTILCVVLIPQSGDSLGTTLGVRSVALLHLGLLHGTHIQGTREGNLNNRTFLVVANLLLFLDMKLTIASNKKRIKK